MAQAAEFQEFGSGGWISRFQTSLCWLTYLGVQVECLRGCGFEVLGLRVWAWCFRGSSASFRN